jgi:osmotically-inducible protein OsmY
MVTLHGVAESDEERVEIKATARGVPGVRDVANRLSVDRK